MWQKKPNKPNAKRQQTEQLSFLDNFNAQLEQTLNTNIVKSEITDRNKDSYPCQLVDDFDRFINYSLENNVQLTKTREYISRKFLPALNDQLSIQSETATKNSEQNYYPYIHLLYFLGLFGGLFKKSSIKSGNKIMQATERLKLFNELSHIEKYYFLLETFWVDLDWNELQDGAYHQVGPSLQELFILFATNDALKESFLKTFGITEENLYSQLSDWHYFLLYFEWFGLWVCDPDHQAMEQYGLKSSYYVKALTVTEFGKQMIPILLYERNLQFWNVPLRWRYGEINAFPGSKLEQLIFLLPEQIESQLLKNVNVGAEQVFLHPFKKLHTNENLQKSLPRPISRFIDGHYIFKVTYRSGVWRTVVLSGQHTMEDLHKIIVQAYDFLDDHLYSFFMDGKKWSEKAIVSPMDDFGLIQANQVRIGEIGLTPGKTFMYLFDYGAEWIFTITLEDLIEQAPTILGPVIKESVGSSPEQYFS